MKERKIIIRKKETWILILFLLLFSIMIGGMIAYDTDGDTKSNHFVIGGISTDLSEDSWEIPEDIVPRQVVSKDPRVRNQSGNDQYVFLQVQVPHDNRMTANTDGTNNPEADIQLFSLDNISERWTLVTADIVDPNQTGYYTYVYAYGKADGMRALKENQITEPLFTSVTYANVIEDETREGEKYYINIKAYAIQVGNIYDKKGNMDGNNLDGQTLPIHVWETIKNQSNSGKEPERS